MESIKKFYDARKKEGIIREISPVYKIENANSDQLKIYEYIMNHHREDSNNQLKMVILGMAGAGKSFLIHLLRRGLGDYLKVMAPTGVAALNVLGTTVHAGLKISIYNNNNNKRRINEWVEENESSTSVRAGSFCPESEYKIEKLKPKQKDNLLDQFVNVKYIIIDEYSMIGQRFLGQIHDRLLEIYHWKSLDTLFAGKSIILIGDMAQIPPIYDVPLWKWDSLRDIDTIRGKELYRSFTTHAALTIQERQKGDAENQAYHQILVNIRNGMVSKADVDLLRKRTIEYLSPTEKKEFDDAVFLFQTNLEVDKHNKIKLEGLGLPTHTIDATNYYPEDYQKKSLVYPIIICKGARVMLTRNLWIDGGLFNGAIGTVEDIIYNKDGTKVVKVIFDGYNGVPDKDGTVPIGEMRFSKFSELRKEFFSFNHLPLKLAYAMTIHKCQGLTLSKVAIELGQRDFAQGQSFVALSRVKKLTDIMLLDKASTISEKRFDNQSGARQRREAEEKRLMTMHI